MKVKIKDKIYDSNNEPIMIVLEDHDKDNISNMSPDDMKYLNYPKNYFKTEEEALKWMGAG